MALVVLRKSRRVTDEFCLFPPYPIAQLLFARPTMMFPAVHAMTALEARSAARHRAGGRRAVIVRSRPGGGTVSARVRGSWLGPLAAAGTRRKIPPLALLLARGSFSGPRCERIAPYRGRSM